MAGFLQAELWKTCVFLGISVHLHVLVQTLRLNKETPVRVQHVFYWLPWGKVCIFVQHLVGTTALHVLTTAKFAAASVEFRGSEREAWPVETNGWNRHQPSPKKVTGNLQDVFDITVESWPKNGFLHLSTKSYSFFFKQTLYNYIYS